MTLYCVAVLFSQAQPSIRTTTPTQPQNFTMPRPPSSKQPKKSSSNSPSDSAPVNPWTDPSARASGKHPGKGANSGHPKARTKGKQQTAGSKAKRPADKAKKAPQLHPRNRHQTRYDFDALTKANPDLTRFMVVTPAGNDSIDFTNPEAIKVLNRSLLMQWYGLTHWDIPDGYLCPPIPGRADYIHNLADLLATTNNGKIPLGRKVTALDIGCGANCIYPIIGNSEYGWSFVAADIQADSLASAQRNIDANPMLKASVTLREQTDASYCFKSIIKSKDFVDVTLCNPPFHESAEQMARGNERKWKNLGKWDGKQQDPKQLNFGGQSNELWCDGGEAAFVARMIRESREYGQQVAWFTSLVSRQAAIPALKNALKEIGVKQQRVVEMSQGQKSSRFIAWTFQSDKALETWAKNRW